MFLTPKSRILTKVGNQRECNHEMPTLYRIEDTWVQMSPDPQVRQLPPQQLKPMAQLTWSYLTPGPLAVSGIYSEKDIERLREHIMFPAEKPAVLNSIARGLTGHSFDPNTVSLYNMLDEDALNKIAESAASRVWRGFISFGSATAGLFGIFLIIRLIKIIIDTTIHGYALHTAYGCSMHLLGALWSSITHLLLHLARGPVDKDEKQQQDEQIAVSKPIYSSNDRRVTTDAPTCPAENQRQHIEPTVIVTTPTYTYYDLNQRLDEISQIPRSQRNLS
ncbi:uncharacterized protein LOC120359894 [Solenopsis invicta]|nr:uncharacterized protein LOC120359894 [Solenopsis invicta]